MKKFGFRPLNLPDTIQFRYGNQIINRYAADGRKLGTEYFTRVTNLAVPLITGQVINQTYTINPINQNVTDYIDNKEYNTLKGNPALTTLQRVYNAEGYTQNITATTPNYYYYRRDHLGNNREVWLANTKKTVQRTQYYPSGLPWASIASDSTGLQERKYNGKEFVEMHGYDTYDYGARGYYAAMGRPTTPDPLMEKYYDISPYAWCGNNPVNRIDQDGRDFTISIQRNVNNEIIGITFSATVYITGDGADQNRADELTDLAKETYKSKKSNGVKISFDVKYKIEPTDGVDLGIEGKNLLTFYKSDGRSEVEGDRDIIHSGYQGDIYNSLDKKSSNYDVMHETAHFLGLSDRYYDTIDKKGKIVSIPDKGYENDIMGKNGKFDLSPNHYANMYEFAISQPAIQQDKYIKQILVHDKNYIAI